jgi:hypothetical protein
MNQYSRPLARILAEQGRWYPLVIPKLGHDLRDTLALLEVTAADRALAKVGREQVLELVIDRPLRKAIGEHPRSLWVLDVPATEPRGNAIPFAPPHTASLSDRLPIAVHETVSERLEAARLQLGDDLVKAGGLRLGEIRLGVVGLRTLAALDSADAERLTWWLPEGYALELRLEVSHERARLVLVDVVAPRDRSSAHSGPTALIALKEGASLPLVTGDGAWGPRAAAAGFQPERSDLMDAWVRYSAAEREQARAFEQLCKDHPLPFRGARQSGRGWLVEIALSDAARKAWLGEEGREGRKIRLSQPVALAGQEDGGRFSLEHITLVAPGLGRGRLRARRGTARLPEAGELQLQSDYGQEVKRDREREALELLCSGRSACPGLMALLRRPGEATPPRTAPLSRSPTDLLDEDQLRAVQLILACVNIVAIQGPPGTGKTRVIVEALRQIAARRARGAEPLRVLVSSVQNEAVANVAERLAEAEGMLVKVIQRQARDEDEGLDFAQRLDAERSKTIERLRSRLEGFDCQPRLDALAELGRLVDTVRTAALADDRGACARRLAALQEHAGKELSAVEYQEIERLQVALEAAEAPDASEAPPTPPAAQQGPAAPREVAAWWERVGSSLPADQRAALGFEVQRLLEALELPEGPRRERRVERAWGSLSPRIKALAPAPAPEASDPVDLLDRVEAICTGIRCRLSEEQAQISQSPRAIALRFLRDLEADPTAWQRIVDRHGSTVAATCSKAAQAALPPGEEYDWVIIDEAGRASPFELLVPMVQGRRVVLIGDHRQLPPTIDDNIVRRADMDLRVDLDQETLFGELYRRLPPGCRGRLSTQYRMHGAIGRLVDFLFYRPNGEGLKSWFEGERAGGRTASLGVLDDRPLAWVDVAPGAERCSEHNPAEVRAICELVRRFAEAGAGDGHVAVIIPYQQQRQAIQRALDRDASLARVALVKTIDAVQGREYPVVILGLTRTDGGAGFLASPNRLNVAISRAQEQLIVVGSRSSFLNSRRVLRRAKHLVGLVKALKSQEVML